MKKTDHLWWRKATAWLLTAAVTCSLPGTPVFGSPETGGLFGETENSEWQDAEAEKATDSNAEEAVRGTVEKATNSNGLSSEKEETTKDQETEDTGVSKATVSDAQEKEPAQDADVETKKIVSWTWKENAGEETLIDGKLLLTNGTEESQPSFDDIVSMLPEKIRADVEWESVSDAKTQAESGDEDADEEIFLEGTVEDTQTITLDGWNCDEYEQDTDDRWPMTGTFLFEAELPEGYELADAAEKLSVEVVMEEPGIAVMDEEALDPGLVDVTMYSGTYDGQSHDLFTSVKYNNIAWNGGETPLKVEYKVGANGTYQPLWTNHKPGVKNVEDNNTKYYIQITYNGKTLGVDKAYSCNIKAYDLSSNDTKANIISNAVEYDGEAHTPQVTVSGVVNGKTVTFVEGTDYELKWRISGHNDEVSSLKDAAVYKPIVRGTSAGNLINSHEDKTNEESWVIYQKKVSLNVEGNEKIYDGTNALPKDFSVTLDEESVLENERAGVTLQSGNQDGYDYADVGSRTIILKGYALTGENSKNYTLPTVEQQTIVTGIITPADITDIYVDKIAALTYNGKEQTPEFSPHATTIKPEINQPTFYYSATLDGEYTTDVPKFTEAGDHTLYYVVKATNHKDSEKGSFTVHVDKADLSTANITATVEPESFPYNKGQVQKPDLTVYLNDKKIDSENYTVQYIYENGENEEIVKEPVNAGTYKIQITGRGNCKGTRVLTNKFMINPLTMPALADMNIAIGYRTTGKLEYPITGLPVDCGNVWNVDLTVDDSSSLFSQADVHAEIRDGRVVLVLNAKKHNAGQINEKATVHLKDIHADNYIKGSMDIIITISDRSTQTKVPTAAMTFAQNSDGETFTAEIAKVTGAEYSFDGTTWSDENRKTDCLPDTAYTGYIRFAETDEFNPGSAASVTKRTGKISAQAPVANPAGKTFQGSLSVTLTTATKNAKIFYTLDGTTPTESSSLYTGPITVSDSVTLKAIAVKTNLETSPVLTAVYTKQASNNTNNSGGSTSGGSSSSGGGYSSDSGTSTSSTRVDAQKGLVSSTLGIITGENNKRGGDGYSHWMQDERGWWLCYSDGSYPQGTHSNPEQQANVNSGEAQYQWELVNGRWFAFDSEGYMATGWIINQGVWYYLEADGAMKTGWQKIGDTWYYLNADGSMRTDGIYLDGVYHRFDPETGAWIAG